MKIKTADLKDLALNWAASVAEGYQAVYANGSISPVFKPREAVVELASLRYSTDWAKSGPIIDREKINLVYRPDINCSSGEVFPRWISSVVTYGAEGPTPLIAAMRCFVASRMGDEVDVPDELVAEHHSAPVDAESSSSVESPK